MHARKKTEGELPPSRCSPLRRWRSSPRRSRGSTSADGRRGLDASCDGAKIGFQGPITGDAAFIGKEQLELAQYAIKKLAGGKIKLSQQDTQLDPYIGVDDRCQAPCGRERARCRGRRQPQEVLAVVADLQEGTAAALDLRLGDRNVADGRLDPELFGLSRTTASRSTAKYIRQILKAKSVFIVDDQTGVLEAARRTARPTCGPAASRRRGNWSTRKATDFSVAVSRSLTTSTSLTCRGRSLPTGRSSPADEGAGQECRHLRFGRSRLR